MRAFVDTNVWVYVYDQADPRKQRAARRVLDDVPHLVLSTQVLQELYNVLVRQVSQPLTHDAASGAIDLVSGYAVVGSDAELVRAAVLTVGRHQLSIWDALIVEAAVRGRCDVLFTEDLSAGSAIRGVEIVNPFAG